MPTTTPDRCLTCHGTGETASDDGPQVCPDCYGEGKPPSGSARMEWRVRQLEAAYRGSGGETEADVLWLVHELRATREALLCVLARCQDADEGDALARDVRHLANEALGLYPPA